MLIRYVNHAGLPVLYKQCFHVYHLFELASLCIYGQHIARGKGTSQVHYGAMPDKHCMSCEGQGTWNVGWSIPSLCSTISEWQMQMLSQKSAAWKPSRVSSAPATQHSAQWRVPLVYALFADAHKHVPLLQRELLLQQHVSGPNSELRLCFGTPTL